MIFSSLFVVVLSILVIVACVQLGWWVSAWVCAIITEAAILIGYTSLGVGSCSYGGAFNCDEVSCVIVWLSFFISSLSLLGSNSVLIEGDEEVSFLIYILALMNILVICFSANSLLVFYVFFELSLIPTFLIICGWGYQPERLRASKFMVLYTVGASLPLLMFILCLIYSSGSVSLSFFSSWNLNIGGFFTLLAVVMAFLVKAPIYGLHMWLPKAHVEAPVAGSILLAGVLLKLGGYGLVRFMPFLSVCDTVVFSCVICLCVFGGIMGSVICCFQTDVKNLVAYSSVGHISLVLCGLLGGSLSGLAGSCLLIVAHGLSSPGMFYLVSEMYKLFSSRSLFVIHGILGNLMGINIWLALMCGFTAAAPPSLSICGEIILYISLMSYSLFFSVFLGVMSFLSCLYSWLLYCNTQTGNYPVWVRSCNGVTCFYLQGIVCSCLSLPLVGLCVMM